MKFRKLGLFLLMTFICNVLNLFSDDSKKGLELKIKFSNQSIYYLNSDIFIEASLVNSSKNMLGIEIGDVDILSFDFDVTSMANLRVSRSVEYVKNKSKNIISSVRNISLRPNEKLSILMNLNQFAKFNKGGVFFVKGIFYPNISDLSKKIESNVITLFLKPEDLKDSNVLNTEDIKEVVVLKRESLSPDKVVEYILKARQLNDKEKFFLYFDAENFMLNDYNKSYLYKQSPESNKNAIEEYKNLLWHSNDYDILKIPSKFFIVETSYTDKTGKVIADLYFENDNFYVSKRYTFFLKKYDYYWVIYDYFVQNMGIKEK